MTSMQIQPLNPSDVRTQWANGAFTKTTQHSLETRAPTAADWIERMESIDGKPSPEMWIAFQLLAGNTTHWRTATRAANPQILAIQFHQLNVFARHFLDLSAAEKQSQFSMLEEHTIDNPIAALRLEPFRQFLSLEPIQSLDGSADVVTVIRFLLAFRLVGPYYRKHQMCAMFALAAKDPDRWRIAARELKTRHPKFAQMGIHLVDQMIQGITIELVHDLNRPPEDLSPPVNPTSPSTFFPKLQQWADASPHLVVAGLIVSGVIVGLLFSKSSNPSLNRPTAHSFDVKPFTPRVSEDYDASRPSEVILESFHQDIDQYEAIIRILGGKEAIAAFENMKSSWLKIAETRGLQGLDAYERTLNDRDKREDVVSPDTRVPLRLFRMWRTKIGDAIATEAEAQRTDADSGVESGIENPVDQEPRNRSDG